MNTARKITDVDAIPAPSEHPATSAEKTVHEVMMEASQCREAAHLDALMRSRGPQLVEALTSLAEVDRPPPTQSLEARLKAIGARQNILDNLAIARLHAARADRTWFALARFDLDAVPEAHERGGKFFRARWEYAFGVTFLSMLASGAFPQDAPGVDLVLPWMRRSARKASVHATMLEDASRAAA